MVKKSLSGWVHQDSDEGLVHVNVGGLKRSLCSSTLKKFPDTRLGKLLACDSEEAILQVCDDYDVQQKEFYFDRNPSLFPYVLHFYQTGKLHIMDELCVFSFSQEIEYWGINEFFLDSCCSYRFQDRKLESSRYRSWDDESEVSSVDTSVDEISDLYRDMQHFEEVRYGNIRKCLWLTLENPGYSIPSKLFSLLSIGVVIMSIASMCINSISEYQTFDANGKLMEDATLQALEVFCTCWFTFEVVTRLLLAPNRRKFFHHPLNIIDIVSVVPIYVTLIFDMTVGSESELGDLGRLIQHSYREVGILLLYLAVGVSVFSGIAYTAEYEEDVGLDTIPACWWWGTVSMTTVGYGDVVPVTVMGKLAASGCILGGTLVVALPITIIFNKFSHFYRRQKALEASVRNNNCKRTTTSRKEEQEEGGSDEPFSRCLDDGEDDDDDYDDDSEEDDMDYEDEGGVVNYSYVEHLSYTPTARKKHPL
ncbi:potassium voltage-gated channel subfamily S member 2 isoform X2 [Thalassophryne amazonica]|uniref:potassium voltage-gated channel subfamily S member 2 isoform X2 n=1 Tax=Thalassophryne amazonica TaxID=390379 RepID=UPI0014717029|nr:potassium voltage-gated channel subfamily S member 2 isoform X2 [Thalassophryne amazonica]